MVLRATVKLKHWDKEITFIKNIPQFATKAGTKTIKRSADFVQRSMKARAVASNRWAASGTLSKGIKVKPGKRTNEIIIDVDARSGLPQETGFKPHYVSIGHLSERARRSIENYTMGKSERNRGTSKGKKGCIFVTENTPIIEPSLEKLETKIDKFIEEELNKVIT